MKSNELPETQSEELELESTREIVSEMTRWAYERCGWLRCSQAETEKRLLQAGFSGSRPEAQLGVAHNEKTTTFVWLNYTTPPWNLRLRQPRLPLDGPQPV